jgi:hypothetical protein
VCVCVCVCMCVWHGAAIARCMEGGEYEMEGGEYEMEGGEYEMEGGEYEMEGGEYEMEKLRVLEAFVEMCVYISTGCSNSTAHGGGL